MAIFLDASRKEKVVIDSLFFSKKDAKIHRLLNMYGKVAPNISRLISIVNSNPGKKGETDLSD